MIYEKTTFFSFTKIYFFTLFFYFLFETAPFVFYLIFTIKEV